MSKLLIIEDDVAFCQMLERFLDRKGFAVETAHSGQNALKKIKTNGYDLVISDLRLPNTNGIDLLRQIRKTSAATPVVLMTGYAEVDTAVRAMKEGALDYISKPFAPEEILMVIQMALDNTNHPALTPPFKDGNGDFARPDDSDEASIRYGIRTVSEKLGEYSRLVAPTDMSVLITGESGTGKEVTARRIHQLSTRSHKPFVAVDCGAIPKELAASEFFGHLKGSFTGAVEDKMGQFQVAHGGTLFLDEVGNLCYENQMQLLRALQERRIKRIGSTKEIEVDVRILSATNEDLLEAVEQGRFREDLYHRLNEFSINVPSLADRGEDLLLFSQHFLGLANKELGRNVSRFSDEVLRIFKGYSWPGNLRELKNVIKRSVLLTTGDQIETDVLPKEVFRSFRAGTATNADTTTFSRSKYEREHILKALQRTNFNKTEAAKLLQIARKTLYNKINQYNMDL